MIRDAKEARDIRTKDYDSRMTHRQCWESGEALGYLAALEGPEIKVLVASGLAAVAQLVVADEEYTKASGGAILVDTKKVLRDWKVALEKYQKAVKP